MPGTDPTLSLRSCASRNTSKPRQPTGRTRSANKGDCSTRPNTVQLGGLEGWLWWSGGLWPVGVSGSFDVPFGVFAFDDERVRSMPPFGQEPADEFADGVAPQAGASA